METAHREYDSWWYVLIMAVISVYVIVRWFLRRILFLPCQLFSGTWKSRPASQQRAQPGRERKNISCQTQKWNFWKRPATDFDKNYIFGIGTSSAIEWYLSFLLSISWPSDEPCPLPPHTYHIFIARAVCLRGTSRVIRSFFCCLGVWRWSIWTRHRAPAVGRLSGSRHWWPRVRTVRARWTVHGDVIRRPGTTRVCHHWRQMPPVPPADTRCVIVIKLFLKEFTALPTPVRTSCCVHCSVVCM